MDLFIKNEADETTSYTVAEFGCGAYSPIYSNYHDHPSFTVTKYDLTQWDDKTNVLNLNLPDPELPEVDIAVFSGVLEYLDNVPELIASTMKKSSYILLSYAFVSGKLHLDDSRYLIEIAKRDNSERISMEKPLFKQRYSKHHIALWNYFLRLPLEK